MSIWTEASPDSIGMILTQAMKEFAELDKQKEDASKIFLFLVVTRYVSVNMFSIADAEVVNAALITGVIFLLALRGFLRNRCLINLIICMILRVRGWNLPEIFRRGYFLITPDRDPQKGPKAAGIRIPATSYPAIHHR